MLSIKGWSSAAALASLLVVSCKPFIAPHKDGGAEHAVGDTQEGEVTSSVDSAGGESSSNGSVAQDVTANTEDASADVRVDVEASYRSDAEDGPDDGDVGAGAAPNPIQLPPTGLLVQLEADYGVVASSDNLVSEWRDKSGNGYDASEPDGNFEPAFVAGINAGYGALMFGVNGGEDLFLPEGFSDLQRGVSLFFVVNIQDTTGVDVLLSMLPNGPMLDLVSDAAMDLLSVDYHVGAGSTTGGRAYAFPYHNWHLVELVQQSGSVGGTSTFTAYLDGTVLVTASQNVPGREVKTPKLGPTLQQGYMFMQAALIYSEPVSNDERRQIERYLMSKWKIPP